MIWTCFRASATQNWGGSFSANQAMHHINCYQTLKCCCHQKSRRNLMTYSNQAQSYITDEGKSSSIFGLLASHFKSRLNLRLYKPSPQTMTQNLFNVIQWPRHRPTTTLALT
jgi:hypothetical protein